MKFAGLIKIIDGKVEAYNDDSGHYYPDKDEIKVHMYNATKILSEQNVLSTDCTLTCHHGEDSAVEMNPREFLKYMDYVTPGTGKSRYREQVEMIKEKLISDREVYKKRVHSSTSRSYKLKNTPSIPRKMDSIRRAH